MTRYKSKMEPIPIEKFLKLADLKTENFGLSDWKKIKQIVAPVDIKKIFAVNVMPLVYLKKLLWHVGLLGNSEIKAYEDTEIILSCVDPNLVLLGQKFVYREKYTAILENFGNLFKDFAISQGISKLTPFLITGLDFDGNYVLAHYLPPIIEVHDTKLILLDGVHRCFIVKQSGGSLEAIIIKNVKIPFPCIPKPWEKIKVIEKRPENIDERYFDLKIDLFRDLKGIGIDG